MNAQAKNNYDLQSRLREYFPVLFQLLNEQKLDWKMINSSFERKFIEHKNRYSQRGAPFLVEVSFYGYVVAYANGKKEAESFLIYLNNLFESLNTRLNDQEKSLIRGSITGVFSNMGLKFLNFVGELAVLNNFKRNKDVVLNATEYPHSLDDPAGPRIDFRFVSPKTSDALLVEVMNIKVDQASIWDESKVRNHITQKITEKLSSKGIRKDANFILIPVLWGSYADLKAVMSFYEKKQPEFRNTMIPMAYISFRDPKESLVHVFGPIDKIFDTVR